MIRISLNSTTGIVTASGLALAAHNKQNAIKIIKALQRIQLIY